MTFLFKGGEGGRGTPGINCEPGYESHSESMGYQYPCVERGRPQAPRGNSGDNGVPGTSEGKCAFLKKTVSFVQMVVPYYALDPYNYV